jgi:hypothetical protein
MDTALVGGDFARGSNGRVKQIGGTQELLQRAAIRLNVPPGGFVYDASLGNKLYTLKADDPGFTEKALALAQEALRPLSAVTAEGVRCPEPAVLAVQVSCRGKSAEIEVKLT